MNYRHAFHAGNFADVFKHLLVSRILVYLIRKPAPLRYIDTHAGIGSYDLAGPEARRTGEWQSGIGRLDLDKVAPDLHQLLTPYLDAVGSRLPDGRPKLYPGSPALAQYILRPTDRLLLAELHPDDALALRKTIGRDKRVKILAIDGYAALNGSVPPPERRGLVLIDPPFEERNEFDALAGALATATRKWATGTYAIWYPIKTLVDVASFHRHLGALCLAKTCTFEIVRDGDPMTPMLRGCGLFVVNPPHVLAEEARSLLPLLCRLFSDSGLPPFRGTIRGQDGLVQRL